MGGNRLRPPGKRSSSVDSTGESLATCCDHWGYSVVRDHVGHAIRRLVANLSLEKQVLKDVASASQFVLLACGGAVLPIA